MQKDINVLNKTFRPFNSHLVVEPHVAPLVMNYDFFVIVAGVGLAN